MHKTKNSERESVNMKNVTRLLAGACALVLGMASVQGEDLVTKSGRVFKNYRILEASKQGLKISHSEGVAYLLFSDVPYEVAGPYSPDLQLGSGRPLKNYSVVKISHRGFMIEHQSGTEWVPFRYLPAWLLEKHKDEVEKAETGHVGRVIERLPRYRNFNDGLAFFRKNAAAMPDHPKIGELKNTFADYAAAKIRQSAKFEDGVAIFSKTVAALPGHPKIRELKNTFADYAAAKIRESAKFEDGVAIFSKTVAALPDYPKISYVKDVLADCAVVKIRQCQNVKIGSAVFSKFAAVLPGHPKIETAKDALADCAVQKKSRENIEFADGFAAFEKIIAILSQHPKIGNVKVAFTDFAIQQAWKSANYEAGLAVFEKISATIPNSPGIGRVREQKELYVKKEENRKIGVIIRNAVRQAQESSDPAEAIALLNRIVATYPGHESIGSVKEEMRRQQSFATLRALTIDDNSSRTQIFIRKMVNTHHKFSLYILPIDRAEEVERIFALLREARVARAEKNAASAELELAGANLDHNGISRAGSKARAAIQREKNATLKALRVLRKLTEEAHPDPARVRGARFWVLYTNSCRLGNISGPIVLLVVDRENDYRVWYKKYTPPDYEEWSLK